MQVRRRALPGQALMEHLSTSATLNAAGAFAIASTVFASQGETAYANTLKTAALKAWDWAVANPERAFL